MKKTSLSEAQPSGTDLPVEIVRRCLLDQAETGMGYQTGDVVLRNGEVVRHVAFVDGRVAEVRGCSGIPFDARDVVDIKLTHVRWSFRR